MVTVLSQGDTTMTKLRLAATVGMVFAFALTAQATTIWTGLAGDGYWTNDANWSAGAPASGDDAFITNGAATITINQDITVNSLTVTGSYSGSITFPTGVVASLTVNSYLYLGSAAKIVPTFTSLGGNGTGRTITVNGDATIDGTIDGSGCGFLRYDTNPGPQGPGFVMWSAAHGGLATGVGPVYGSITQPTSLGSGDYNGRGGGAIKLKVTGTATVNGTITADSDNATYAPAGGSIWIDCGTLAGIGTIRANSVGGASYPGGGGRVSLNYTTRTYTGTISVKGAGVGQPGSLWDPALFASAANVTLDNQQYQYFFSGAATNFTWGLTVTNGANVYFHSFTNGVLTLTNLVVASSSKLRFDVDNAGNYQKPGINRLGLPYTPVNVIGSSLLGLPSQAYTCSTFNVSAGSVVYLAIGDTNAINAASGGTVGTPHGVGATFICDSASINGTLTASSAGFPAKYGPGGTTHNWDGGSYGGLGGANTAGQPPTSVTYGSLTKPTALGSGGTQPGAIHYAGGAIKLVATNGLTVNGGILADGGCDGTYDGDSGGSIWLVAGALSGTGLVSAVGGHGNFSGSHGGGGGGRMAVEYVSSTFLGTMAVTNGWALNSPYPAQTGTLFLCQSPYPGACSLGYGGLQLDSLYSVKTNGVKIVRSVGAWVPQNPRAVWTDTSTSFTGTTITNVATYTLSGMPLNKALDILTNNAAMMSTNSGSSGTITFNVTLTAPTIVSVSAGGMGAVDTLAPTNVTATSACMNGSLTSAGAYDTAVLTYWGPTDGGIDATAWSNVCIFPAPQPLGVCSTNVALPATGEYFYRCAASNAAGVSWSDHSEYVLPGVTIGVMPTAIGERNETASFWVSRGVTATSRAVTVSFLVGGTVTNTRYTLSSYSNITMAAGVSSGVVQALTFPDVLVEPDQTVILTLTSSPTSFYGVGTPGSATLTVTNSPPLQITWTSATAGYWTNGANWSGGVAPVGADDVFFTNGSATVTIDQDVAMNSLTITGSYSGIITFKTGVVANLTVNNNFYLGSSGKIVPTYASLLGNGVGRTITVNGDARIDGTIDATGCGFLRADANPGYQGPGLLNWAAAHGGLAYRSGPVYGSITQPTSLGSGNNDGRGGGAVKLKVTGTATVNGTITADSDSGTYAPAGGSIWIDCATLAGNGAIRANSVGGTIYPGSGGRVSLNYTTRTYTGTISVKGTSGAQPGSLWDPALFANPVADITLSNQQYQYFFPGIATNYTWGLTLTNGANVYFHSFTNGVMTLTKLVVVGGSVLRFDVDDAGSSQKWGIDKLALPYTPVSVTGSSTLGLPSLSYTCSTFNVEAGSFVYASQGDTNAVNADSGGTGGNPHGAGLTLLCDSATVNGRLDASSAGFAAQQGPGKASGVGGWDGGSYGGQGGGQSVAPTAPCYGSLTRPSALGSGAAIGGTYYAGGAIKLVATNALTVNGAIRADGGNGGGAGGASGGSIWLVAGALSGTGTVSAIGGYGNLTGSHAGGGGGRVAVEYVSSTFSGSLAVTGGWAQSSAYVSRTGTLFQCQSPYPGVCSLGYGGLTLGTTLSTNSSDVKLVRSVAQWSASLPNLIWTDTATRMDNSVLTNSATYALLGFVPRTLLTVKTNDTAMLTTNISVTGSLTFTVPLVGATKISIAGYHGTVFMMQ